VTVSIEGTTPGIAVDGSGAVVNVTVTTGGGGGGGVSLGETSTTAYRGDRGKTAYDHSQIVSGNPHGTTAADVGAAAASHTHNGTQVTIDASGFNGNLTTSDDTVQEVAQKLDDLVIPAAGIADPGGANDDILQRKSGAWTNRTVAQVKTDLGIPGVEIVYSQDEGSAVNLATSGTSLLDTAPTLTMAAGDVVEIEVWFNQVNNSGALRQQTIALKLGSTTLMTLLNVYGASATTYAACVRASIRAQGTTDVNASGVLLSAIGTLVVLGHGVATENVGTGVTVDVLGAAPTATATQTMTVQHIKIVKVKA